MYTEIKRCRMCGSAALVTVLELGQQYLSGIFPRDKHTSITRGPLTLVLCEECELLQLKHSYDLAEMYGMNYGYRSGLNRSMVEHLERKVAQLVTLAPLKAGDVVLDIGSNDGTLLGSYPDVGATRIGIDPSGAKFKEYYKPGITLVPDFFSAAAFRAATGGQKAKIVTSIAMFYDLESPLSFMQQVESVLADDGIWHFEQSYLPLMLQANAYDTVCHEHLEYYGLAQIKWMADRANLRILDVQLNDINGGSFAVSVAKQGSSYSANDAVITELLRKERELGIGTAKFYDSFRAGVFHHRDEVVALIRKLNAEGKKVFGYGASTKGNVVLQFCNLTDKDLPSIAEVNPDKFGCFTPGTLIPIESERDAKAAKPDYFFVLPWHFRTNIVEREASFLAQGGRLIFPLPKLEIVGR